MPLRPKTKGEMRLKGNMHKVNDIPSGGNKNLPTAANVCQPASRAGLEQISAKFPQRSKNMLLTVDISTSDRLLMSYKPESTDFYVDSLVEKGKPGHRRGLLISMT
jgi:hypothetical protein